MKERVFIENGKYAGEILLEELGKIGVLSESFIKKTNSQEMIFEASVVKVSFRNEDISRDIFDVVYSDYKNYDSREKIFSALGFDPNTFGETEKQRNENIRKSLNRLIDRFNDLAETPEETYPKFDQRQRFYVQKAREEAGVEDEFEDPTINDIFPGSRSRKDKTSRVLDKINAQDLLQGEFYSNMTRIPKQRWGSWLRFWDKQKTSVARDKSLLGREWKKHFIFGYQVEQSLLYEIWYNSIDSTFTVHDHNGNEVSNRMRTMTEAVKSLIAIVSQSSSSDAAIFHGSNIENRQLAQSITRALFTDTDDRADMLRRIDDKEQQKNRAERRLALKEKRAKQQLAKDVLKKAGNVINYDREVARGVGEDPRNKEKPEQHKWKNEPNEAQRKSADARMKSHQDQRRKEKEELDKFYHDIPKFSDEDDLGDIPEFTYGYNKERVTKSKQTAKEKRTADDLDIKDIDNREYQIRQRIKRTQERIKKTNQSVNPDISVNEEISYDSDGDLMSGEIDRITDKSAYESEIKRIRSDAKKSPYTQHALKQSAMGQISTYDTTRVQNDFGSKLMRFLNKGRSQPIVLPTDKPSVLERAKMAFRGQRYRADFILGFTLSDKVNLEIWYITEPNPEYTGKIGQNKTVSTFYVFDITSSTTVRKYLPYFRNAIQVVMAKLGAF